jgi:hypothetical protein
MANRAMLNTRGFKATSRALVLTTVALSAFGCESRNASRPYQFKVRVSGDPGRAVAGAVLTFKSQAVASSDASGLARLSARGQEGETLDFGVTCPDGFRSPSSPLSVRLTRLSDDARLPEYQVSCAPALRNVVVAVRAENGADLPVEYLGQEVARTDSAGAAHFMLRVEPGEQLEVKLDTHEKHWLKPQDPAIRFLARSEDELLLFDQPFVVTHDNRHSFVTGRHGPVHF